MSELNQRLLEAHATGDKAALVALYHEAAQGTVDPDVACFYLTQAYVFALETSHADTQQLHQLLKTAGREA